MSGIVGIINPDRQPVDPEMLRGMTRHMAFRGPDAQEIWSDTYVGLGHAMLRTTFEMATERQPWSLDGKVWITADARIDARDELKEKLRAKGGCRALEEASETHLILCAYQVWGTDCVQHLIGDFAFAIWDGPRQRLFCARDHFGVRPFYYAELGGGLIFSNNLETIRRHPRVSDELNDLAIVNYLLFRYQPRVDQTSFKDIQSLLPAHTLIFEGGKTTLARYWTLPIEDPIRYKRHDDYIDHFRELFDRSVGDRMRTDRAGILMSGGMDSSSVAASLQSARGGNKHGVKAFTYVYDRLIPDEERRYAGLVAKYLDIPIQFIQRDDQEWFGGWDKLSFRFPEPFLNLPFRNDDDSVRRAALDENLRVFFCGWGPDVMLDFEPAHYQILLRHRRISDLVVQVGNFVSRYRRAPPLLIRSELRRQWRRLWARSSDSDEVKDRTLALLAPSVAQCIEIPTKWWQFSDQPGKHEWRPQAYSMLTNYYWTLGFGVNDASNWHAPLEFVYPYFDLRMVRYLLRVPVLPWCADKMLLRQSMSGKLPGAVIARPKAPVRGEPKHSYSSWVSTKNLPSVKWAKYVDRKYAGCLLGSKSADFGDDLSITHRLIALNHWLRHYS